MSSEIYVCQVGTCRRNGSEAVLLEIEELVTDENCKVEGSGCLGLCNRAPNAVVLKEGRREEKAFTRLNSLEKTIEVVKNSIVNGDSALNTLDVPCPVCRESIQYEKSVGGPLKTVGNRLT